MKMLKASLAKVNLGDKDCDGRTRPGAADSVFRTGPFPPIGLGCKNIIAMLTASSGSTKNILQNSLQTVEKSCENDLIWIFVQAPSMVDIVASEPFSLVCSKSMLLEENETKLIDMAKRCRKSLSTSASGSKPKTSISHDKTSVDLDMALLRVAIYFLRSILPATFDSSKSQSTLQVVLKLLYHCAVLSGYACLGMFETFTALFTSSSSGGKD